MGKNFFIPYAAMKPAATRNRSRVKMACFSFLLRQKCMIAFSPLLKGHMEYVKIFLILCVSCHYTCKRSLFSHMNHSVDYFFWDLIRKKYENIFR